MRTYKSSQKIIVVLLSMVLLSCGSLAKLKSDKVENGVQPESFNSISGSKSSAYLTYKDFFKDPYLLQLIDTALQRNQELQILLQEILITQNEVQIRKGEYLPFLNGGVLGDLDKVGRYTSQGAADAITEIIPGKENPEVISNMNLGLQFSWELDIWKKLRNAKKSAYLSYLATEAGKNFILTQLIAELAENYYSLIQLDKAKELIINNINIQNEALNIAKLQQAAGKTTSLSVLRFDAELSRNKALVFYIDQEILERENQINFLLGRFPQPILRSNDINPNTAFAMLDAGLPNQLLENRADIQEATLNLEACKLDVFVAKAAFYPSITLRAGAGFGGFNSAYLFRSPESMLFNVAGDLVAPLVNRNALIANYKTANSKQIQAIFNYEKSILEAHVEVVNLLGDMNNLRSSSEQIKASLDALNQSIEVCLLLYGSAKIDYQEVLLTQRDALEVKMQDLEISRELLIAQVQLYRALGGGWR